MHQEKHTHYSKDTERLIQRFRRRCGVEDIWQIETHIGCWSKDQQAEASIRFDAEVWYAHLFVCCEVTPDLLIWCVLHELCELQRWRSALCFLEAYEKLPPEPEAERLLRQFHQQRNQEIELQVAGLLNNRRPGHLVSVSSID
jgi:hypothetical protein